MRSLATESCNSSAVLLNCKCLSVLKLHSVIPITLNEQLNIATGVRLTKHDAGIKQQLYHKNYVCKSIRLA